MTYPTRSASLVILLSSLAFGQPAPSPAAFEVGSIKPHEGPLFHIMEFSPSGSRLTMGAYLLSWLVAEAYGLKSYQLSFSVPNPDPDTWYDILAKAEGDAARTRNEFRQMLQTLLAERCHLKVHRQMMEQPVYALVVDRGGPKFKESTPEVEAHFLGGVNGRYQTIETSKATMQRFADALSERFSFDRPVVDRTGLTGTYDLKIEASLTSGLQPEADPNEITIFAALKSQLGLRLDRQEAMVEMLVIDHLEKPSAN